MARRSGWLSAASLFAVAILVAACAAPGGSFPSSPSPSPTAPPASPTAPPASPTTSGELPALPASFAPLDAGTYSLGLFPVPFSLAVPDGWEGFGGTGLAAVTHDLGEVGESGLSFWLVRHVYEDPCTSTVADPPVGPGVDDLVGALTAFENFEATSPTDDEIAGLPATAFELTGPLEPVCEQSALWKSMDDLCRCLADASERNRIWVLEVDGIRVLIDALDVPAIAGDAGTPPEVLTELDAIIDSIELVPAP